MEGAKIEMLRDLSFNRIESVQSTFRRYLYHQIDWKDRLIAIKGARGTGKTTLMLQYINKLPLQETLYLSLDHILFQTVQLSEIVNYYYQLGVRYLFLDEVHKYVTWSIEIKNIYDFYPDLKIVFTGSSVLEIHKGQADLSRRLMSYDLQGLSFREFLSYDKNIDLPILTLDELLQNHVEISRKFRQAIGSPLLQFNRYLTLGYYPYFKENESNYSQRLLSTINLILETDLLEVENITYSSTRKLKALLYIVAASVPFKPNISSLSQKVETKRDTLLKFLDLLQRASILRLLRSSTKGVSHLNKPEKIFLDNTNIAHALGHNPDKGNERETFFLNQLSQGHQVTSPKNGDFNVDGQYIFEVGGKDKSNKQIEKITNGYIAADNIETGTGNKIPLWLFGFLY